MGHRVTAGDCELTSYDELADIMQALPRVLREQRRIHRLSLRAAAAEIGVSFSTVSRLESGEVVMSDVVQAVLRWLSRGSSRSTSLEYCSKGVCADLEGHDGECST